MGRELRENPAGQSATVDDLMRAVLLVVPGAQFDESADGEIVIGTNLREREDGTVVCMDSGKPHLTEDRRTDEETTRPRLNLFGFEALNTKLLAACKFALEYLEANEGEYGTEERIKACREAINQVEGGAK